MRLDNHDRTRSKIVRPNSLQSAYSQKKIELALCDYCKAEARGFSSWYELDCWLATEAENNSFKRRN